MRPRRSGATSRTGRSKESRVSGVRSVPSIMRFEGTGTDYGHGAYVGVRDQEGENMGFKRLLASMGAGGASVETELTELNVVPGGVVQGEVRIQGGSVDQQIEGLSVGLQARVE